MVVRHLDDTDKAISEGVEASNKPVWHGIIGTGQSLSVGFQGSIPDRTQPAPHAFRLDDPTNEYDYHNPDAPELRLAPLTEPFRTQDGGANEYPRNIDGLTPHHSMACTIASLHARAHADNAPPYVTTHTAVGKGGALMDSIRKQHDKEREARGDHSYPASLYEAAALHRLARARDAALVFSAIILTHGEADALMQNAEYAEDVAQMQADYAADLRAITGQTTEPLLILTQQNTCPPHRAFLPTVMDLMWRVQQHAPGRVDCAGPKYQYPYAPGGLHLDAFGYARLGEKYGQVYYQSVVEGKPFVPLSPTKATFDRRSKTIRVAFAVPVPPLRWDELLPPPHEGTRCQDYWGAGRGFEVRDARGKRLVIAGAQIRDGESSVAIELAQTQCEDGGEAHTPLSLAYAMTQEGEGFGVGFCGGSSDGRVGWLCDSDRGPGVQRPLGRGVVQRGSRVVQLEDAAQRLSLYDIVSRAEGGGEYAVARMGQDEVELDRAWDAQSGVLQDLTVRHNQRNYCVAFSLDVDEHE